MKVDTQYMYQRFEEKRNGQDFTGSCLFSRLLHIYIIII